MNLLHVDTVYQVDPTLGCLQIRPDVTISLSARQRSDLETDFICHGFLQHDLAFFGHILGDDGVDEFKGLVLESDQQGSVVASSECVIRSPDLITADLARRITTLTLDQVSILGLNRAILEQIRVRSPRFKPPQS